MTVLGAGIGPGSMGDLDALPRFMVHGGVGLICRSVLMSLHGIQGTVKVDSPDSRAWLATLLQLAMQCHSFSLRPALPFSYRLLKSSSSYPRGQLFISLMIPFNSVFSFRFHLYLAAHKSSVSDLDAH